jgi:hypothetical protein
MDRPNRLIVFGINCVVAALALTVVELTGLRARLGVIGFASLLMMFAGVGEHIERGLREFRQRRKSPER